MLLQKMKYNETPVVCVIDCSGAGDGECTLCGNVYFSSGLGFEDHEPVGDPFNGKLKNVTCRDCLKIINFVKGLK